MKRTQAQEAIEKMEEALALELRADCILWPYGRDRDGYGRFEEKGKSFAVHRRACALRNGPPPDDKPHALHSCGNGHLGCFNPHHVYWGSHAQNMRDMVASGRSLAGEAAPSAKLTEAQVRQIRELRGQVPQRELAERFGVHQVTISKIHRGTRWSSISP